MKEIWKLLKLLNEYSKNIWYFNEEDLQWQTKAWILSKEFWWIWWLVENDKIYLEKLPKHLQWEWVNTDIKGKDLVIMVLSIQDEPIRFLCEILK